MLFQPNRVLPESLEPESSIHRRTQPAPALTAWALPSPTPSPNPVPRASFNIVPRPSRDPETLAALLYEKDVWVMRLGASLAALAHTVVEERLRSSANQSAYERLVEMRGEALSKLPSLRWLERRSCLSAPHMPSRYVQGRRASQSGSASAAICGKNDLPLMRALTWAQRWLKLYLVLACTASPKPNPVCRFENLAASLKSIVSVSQSQSEFELSAQVDAQVEDYGQSDGLDFGGGIVAPLSQFPYCVCDTYTCSHGPYRIDYLGTRETADFVDLEFQISTVGCLELDIAPCCAIMKDRLGKIEIEVFKTCVSSYMETFVNGNKQNAYYDTDYATGKIRITPLILNATTANGAIITIRMANKGDGVCNSAETFCLLGDGSCNKWQLEFEGAEIVGTNNVFSYKLSVNNGDLCRDVSYRAGNCCNQTLDSISWAALPDYARSVSDILATTSSGEMLRTYAYNDKPYGLMVQLIDPLYSTSLALGDWIKVDILMSASAWSDTSSFPCPQSEYKMGSTSCDYWVSGFQTEKKKPMNELIDINVAMCCPEGVLDYCPPPPPACNADIDSSPYSLVYTSRTFPVPGNTRLTFTINYDSANRNNECSLMVIEYMTMFLDPVVARDLRTVELAGIMAPYTIETQEGSTYVKVDMSGYRSVFSAEIVLNFAGLHDTTRACKTPFFQGTACTYTFVGTPNPSTNHVTCCPSSQVFGKRPPGISGLTAIIKESDGEYSEYISV
eukprot:gene29964-18031_t